MKRTESLFHKWEIAPSLVYHRFVKKGAAFLTTHHGFLGHNVEMQELQRAIEDFKRLDSPTSKIYIRQRL